MKIRDSDRHRPATVEVRGPLDKGKHKGKYIMGDLTNNCYRIVSPIVDSRNGDIVRWDFEDESGDWTVFKDRVQ